MQIEFLGADHEVTGSCHYMQVGNRKFCIDCGMEQGQDIYENQELPVNPAELDFICITHAHIDHTGLLPLMYAKGFRGQIYAIKATVDLCNIMLRDSAHIQMFEAEWRNRKAKRSGLVEPYAPLYTMEDAFGAIKLLTPCEYGQIIHLCDEVSIRFTDVGHLLGSSSIEVFANENGVQRTICFSGDLGNENKPILKNPIYTKQADYVVMESTYGNRYHGDEPDYIDDIASILEETFQRGGNVVIPAFAVGRTQEILYFLRQIKAEGKVKTNPNFKVYVDSPLAVEATSVFNKNEHDCFDDEAKALIHQGINPISFPGLKLSITSDDSKAINFDEEAKVIISASGMCEAGRIRHHLKHNLWRKDSTILFCGYQTSGTVGRALLEGAEVVKLFGENIDVRARICKINGISGHADKGGLTKWIQAFEDKPKRVFVVHGEDIVCSDFAEYLTDEFGYCTNAPYSGTIFNLVTGEFVHEATPIAVQKRNAAKARNRTVFGRLEEAGHRLMAVIMKCKEFSNKDIAKFTDQINSLCDKWEK